MLKKLECSWSFLRATKSLNKQIRGRCFANKTMPQENLEDPNPETVSMPESRGLPILGMLYWMVKSSGGTKLHEYVHENHMTLGPVYRDCVGPVPAVFINSPDEYRRIFRLEGPTPKHYLPEIFRLYNKLRNCRRGLLFMEGNEWLYFRRIMNKILLTPDPGKTMAVPCQLVAELLAKRWMVYAERGIVIPDFENQLYQWSIEVVLAVLMGPSCWDQNKLKMQKTAEQLAKILHDIFLYAVRLSAFPAQFAMKMKMPWWTQFVKSIDEAMMILNVLLPEISLLEGDGMMKTMKDEGIQGEDLYRIVADLIIAAGDTTAYTMQWSLFLLASQLDKQDKLYENIKCLKTEEILRNSLMKGVIKEALRLYPTAPFIPRYLAEDNTIAGFKVSKEELLLLSLYSSGRDPANFTQPDEFQPERWLRTEKGEYEGVINPHATIPFAMGARSCVGRKLAETQLALTIAEIVKNYKMECINKTSIKMKLHMISVPSEPIRIVLTRR